jgi:hypothetical protein
MENKDLNVFQNSTSTSIKQLRLRYMFVRQQVSFHNIFGSAALDHW